MDDMIRLGLMDEGDILLDEAALVLARLDHPDLDPAPYAALLDDIAARLGTLGADADSPQARADALARVLGGEFAFAGDREAYDDPANADLIRVIDRRRGLPISLSILWVAAARRLGWVAHLLDVPGHVLVLIGDAARPVIVDPFRGGERVTPDALVALLAVGARAGEDGGDRPAVRQVAAMPNRAVLLRLLRNQAIRAEQAGKGRRALELYRRMTAVAPQAGSAWWERARLELTDADIGAARDSLAAMLEVTREPGLRARVADTLAALPAR